MTIRDLLTEQRKLAGLLPLRPGLAENAEAFAKWDAMSPAERTKLIKKDKSMRDKRWAPLVMALASKSSSEMTPVQRDSIPAFLAM